MNVVLCYPGEAQRFSFWRVRTVSFEDFHAVAESINVYWVSDSGVKAENDKYRSNPIIKGA